MKFLINKILGKFNYEIRNKSKTRNAFQDQKKLIGQNNQAVTIFDVGAYDGMTALRYNQLFPGAEIHSFEPFPETFLKLQENTADHRNVHIHKLGLGDHEGTSTFHANLFSATNSMLATHPEGNSHWGDNKILDTQEVVEVAVSTLDQFVQSNNIKKIDILKLDVQGAEYMVLDGALNITKANKIKLIYTEIITLPTYQNQKEIGEMISLFVQHGFSLYNIYNLSYNKKGQLRQFDAIFINQSLGIGH